MELEWESKVARLDGRPVDLCAREWAVIKVLGRRRQSTVSKKQIEDSLYAFGEEIESNSIEVYEPHSPQAWTGFRSHDTRSRLPLGRLVPGIRAE